MATITARTKALLQELGHGETSGAAMNALMAEARAILSEAEQFTATPEEIERARSQYATDDIEIDDSEVRTSPTDYGVWVSAWVYLGNAEEENEAE